jgi:hypothetical protein
MEKTQSLLIRQFNYELERIQDEETDNLNISQAFDGIGKFGEILTTAIFAGSIGSASKGGCAFDNHCLLTNKKREVKTCCIIQPKICNSCVQINKDNEAKEAREKIDSSSVEGVVSSILAEIIEKIDPSSAQQPQAVQHSPNQTKVPFFQKRCLFCGETVNFSYPKDSRFSIDCKAHFAYEADIVEYVFHLIDYKDDRIIFETFVIQSANRYFRQMLKNQLEKGASAHCNFLPRSHDFYSSAPIKILEMVYTKDKQIQSFVFNPENREICEYPVELLSKELKKSLKMDPQKTHISYEELEDKLEPKKKNFGKLRGAVVRGGTVVPPLPPHVRGSPPKPQ